MAKGGGQLFEQFGWIVFFFQVFEDNKEEQEQQNMLISVLEWRKFWKKYDPKATGIIKATDFIETLVQAPLPVGFNENYPGKDKKEL